MKVILALATVAAAGILLAQAPEYGPERGFLVIQGGGSDAGTGIFETFINKAGGLGAKIVVVPTAGGNKNPDGSIKVYKEEEVVAPWKKRGGHERADAAHPRSQSGGHRRIRKGAA